MYKFLGNNTASMNIKEPDFLQKKIFTAVYGLDTESETEPEPLLVKNRNRNRNTV